MPSDSDHISARKKWLGFLKHAKRSLAPQELAIQAFALYRLRFVFAADLRQDWSKFGGLGPQLAHLSTVLHLGIAESVGNSLSYHRLVGQKLQGKARKRTASETDFAALLSVENFPLEEQANQEISLAIDSDVREGGNAKNLCGWGERRRIFKFQRKCRNLYAWRLL